MHARSANRHDPAVCAQLAKWWEFASGEHRDASPARAPTTIKKKTNKGKRGKKDPVPANTNMPATVVLDRWRYLEILTTISLELLKEGEIEATTQAHRAWGEDARESFAVTFETWCNSLFELADQ